MLGSNVWGKTSDVTFCFTFREPLSHTSGLSDTNEKTWFKSSQVYHTVWLHDCVLMPFMEWCSQHAATAWGLAKEIMSQEVHWGLTHQWLCRRLSSPPMEKQCSQHWNFMMSHLVQGHKLGNHDMSRSLWMHEFFTPPFSLFGSAYQHHNFSFPFLHARICYSTIDFYIRPRSIDREKKKRFVDSKKQSWQKIVYTLKNKSQYIHKKAKPCILQVRQHILDQKTD